MNTIRSVCAVLLLLLSSSVPGQTEQHVPTHLHGVLLGVDVIEGAGWGVLVHRVQTGSGAEAVGIQSGDRVLGVSGEVIETKAGLQAVIAKHKAGDIIEVVTRREDKIRIVQAKLSRRRTRVEEILQRVLGVLQLKRGQAVADIGFGSGWITKELSQVVGETGRVYAVEISVERVAYLERQQLKNVTCVLSEEEDISLEENTLDLALLHDVASHAFAPARPKFYESVARALKPSGILVVFDPHGGARSMLTELDEYGFRAEDSRALEKLSGAELDRRLTLGLRFSYGH